MNKVIIVALLATLLAGCAHDSPCVPVYDSEGRLVHTNTCMKGTTQDNWETAGAIAGGAAAVAGLTLGIVALTRLFLSFLCHDRCRSELRHCFSPKVSSTMLKLQYRQLKLGKRSFR